MVGAQLIAVTKKRRFHYYRIASPLVAKILESMKAVAAIEVPPRYQPLSARNEVSSRGADIVKPHAILTL